MLLLLLFAAARQAEETRERDEEEMREKELLLLVACFRSCCTRLLVAPAPSVCRCFLLPLLSQMCFHRRQCAWGEEEERRRRLGMDKMTRDLWLWEERAKDRSILENRTVERHDPREGLFDQSEHNSHKPSITKIALGLQFILFHYLVNTQCT